MVQAVGGEFVNFVTLRGQGLKQGTPWWTRKGSRATSESFMPQKITQKMGVRR